MATQKSVHVYSRLANAQRYTLHGKGANDLPIPVGEVFIKGGANLADKNLLTPLGVHTEVSEEDHALLLKNPVFEQHVKNGFITIEDKKHDVDKVVADMGDNVDPSAPLSPSDYKDADGLTDAKVSTSQGKKK